MPRSRRCTYHEGKRRCPFDGIGQPSLCESHRSLLEHEARSAEAPKSPLGNLLSDLLAGKRISRQRIQGAFRQTVETVFQEGTRGVQMPPPGAWQWRGDPPPQGHRDPGPPPVDPEVEAQLRARAVLGFTPDQPLTVADVKRRQKELAKRWHPDRKGGSAQKMAAINDATDVLVAYLGG